jgi:hypothetical protein
MMAFFDALTHATTTAPTPTPSPTPSGPTSIADAALSNYYIAILLVLGTIAVIVAVLVFALRYHERLIKVIELSVKLNRAPVQTVNHDALHRSLGDTEPTIVGPGEAQPSASLTYRLKNVDDDTVHWEAARSTVQASDGPIFQTSFDKPDVYVVVATYTDPNDKSEKTLVKPVVVAVPATTPAINLPFAIRNWGRLVVVIFGVGVIGTLISTKVLDGAVGVGILGTLLGIGAVTATTGTSGTPPNPPDEG